jgi:hypothetical protein
VVESWLHEPIPSILLEHPRVQQIIDFLVVYLKERHIHLNILKLFERLNLLDQLPHTPLNESIVNPTVG